MSEPENFIARWSRRKRAAVEEVEAKESPAASDAASEEVRPPEEQGDESDVTVARRSASESVEPAFDVTKLPPLESITAASDIRAFLAPGVPAELTRAALRRAWIADPKIRDFVGLAENAWDFNAPGSIAGFGPLEMTDELRREVARMVGRALADEDTDGPAPISAAAPPGRPSVETSVESAAATPEVPTQAGQSNHGSSQIERGAEGNEGHNSEPAVQRSNVINAAQNIPENDDNDQVIAKRPHGSALPK
jgi:Protein of unknown function (DUF3306)